MLTSLGEDVNNGPLGNASEVLVFFLSSRVRWDASSHVFIIT